MMSLPRLGLATGVLALQAVVVLPQRPPKFPSKIKAVTAKLYYSDSGTFSENILDKPDLILWNTIIGEGQSGGPSAATLVQVEVDGDGAGNVIHKERLTITIQQQGDPAISRRTGPLFFGENGKHFEAVWILDSGCLPVTISAHIDGQPAVHKKIDFQCGE